MKVNWNIKIPKWIIVCAIVVCLLIGFFLLFQRLYLNPLNGYNEAIALMEAEKYSEAIAIFDELDGFKDSEAKSAECTERITTINNYNRAVYLLNNGPLEDAIDLLKTLGNFRDSDKIVDGLTGPDIVIPDVMTKIPKDAFSFDTSVTSVYIPDSVKVINSRAFGNCINLKSVTFSENSNLSEIGLVAFSNCNGLESIELPDSLKRIKALAFSNCTKLTSITFPNGITEIDGFSDCTGLTSITIPDSVEEINGFAGCLGLTEVNFGEDSRLNSIGDSTFWGCDSLTGIRIPDSVIEINAGAFSECDTLREIVFGENSSLTTIGDFAFANCDSLTSFVIPDSAINIGLCIFSDCDNLTSLTIPDHVIGKLGSCIYNDDSDYWTRYLNLTDVKFSDSVTKLEAYSFQDDYNDFTSVTIPVSVTEMERVVFFDCDKLTTINYEGTVAQWNAIKKASNWYRGSSLTEVICTDGTVSLD